MRTFEWGLIGTLSALLACLFIILAATLVIFTGGCYNYPGCNGFLMLPLLYAGLAGILFALFSFDKIRRLNKTASSAQAIISIGTVGARLKRALGKLLYVLGIGLPVAVMIGSLQLEFPFPCAATCGVGVGSLFNFALFNIIAFDAAMFVIAYLGIRLDPSIGQHIARFTTIAFIIGAIIPGLSTMLLLLQFGFPH